MLLKRLTDSIDIIYQISEKNEDCTVISAGIEEVNKKAKAMESIGPLLVHGILFVVFLFVNGTFLEELGLNPNGGLIIILAIIMAFIEVFTVMVLWLKQTTKKAEDYKNSKLPQMERALDAIAHQLEDLVNTSEARILLETIPQDYATYDAVSFFIIALRNGRADTLKEVINLYENELHKRALIDMHQQEIALEQQQIALQNALLSGQQENTQIQKELLKRNEKISRQVRFSNAIGIMNTVKLWGGKVRTK